MPASADGPQACGADAPRAVCLAARKAVEDAKKRIQEDKSEEAAKLTAGIEELQKESRVLWDNTMKSARVLGANPYPGSNAAKMNELRKGFVYHTTAAWNDRILSDGRRPEDEAPQKMRECLKKVRGY